MAMTHDYLDYLNDKVGISAANSQEELQAAQTISYLMEQHDVEPQVEDFDAPALAGVLPSILSIVMLVGVFVSGFGVIAASLVGFVLAAIPAVLDVLRFLGREVSLSFGPRAQSQNVVAVHRATGPLVTKGNRTIVVVAHYDSPRENILYSSPLAPFLPLISKATSYCVYVVAVCALLQVMLFIPSPARIVFWLVGILASVPSVIIAVGKISELVSPCTVGANDNKSSVAALLGVLENVRPSGLVPIDRTPAPEPEQEPEPAPEQAEAPSETSEVEAGETAAFVAEEPAAPAPELVEETVVEFEQPTVEYVEEPAAAVAPEPEAEVETVPTEEPAPVTGSEVALEPETEPETEPEPPAAAEHVPEPPAYEPLPYARHGEAVLRSLGMLPEDCEIEYLMPESPAPEPVAQEVPAPEPAPEPVVEKTAPLMEPAFSVPVAAPSFEVVSAETVDAPGEQPSGESYQEAVLEADATQPTAPVKPLRPAAPEDPEWGKTSFRPALSSVARRASLFDLPDPSTREKDPFESTDPNTVATSAQPEQAAQPAQPATNEVIAPQPVSVLSSEEDKPKKNFFTGLVDRIKSMVNRTGDSSEGSPESGSWLGESQDSDDVWRGGAAPRSGLRLVEGEEVPNEEVPSEEELREAVLSLGDDALISHDIWFVALGASSLDHAGMRAFLRQHRSEVRGCFVVNLDCVGAGELSVLTHEGHDVTRRCDRRLARLLSGAASDLHVPLAQKSYDWNSTDAHVAMRSSMRSVTLMGVDESGLPALSRTSADVPENVSGDQSAQVAEVVTEMIRRS